MVLGIFYENIKKDPYFLKKILGRFIELGATTFFINYKWAQQARMLNTLGCQGQTPQLIGPMLKLQIE